MAGPYCFSLSLEMPSYGCPSAKHYLTNFNAFFAFGAVSVIRPVETLGTTFRMVATDGDAKNVQSLMQSADTFRRYLKTFLFHQAFLSRHC